MVVYIYSDIISLLMLTYNIELFKSGQERHTIFTLFFLSEGNTQCKSKGLRNGLDVRSEPPKTLKARVVSHPPLKCPSPTYCSID